MCIASGCFETNTPDNGHSCMNCMSYVAVSGNDVCAFDGCPVGRLSRDVYCAWHMQTMYLTGYAQCYLCELHCASGRYCAACASRCQYMDNTTVLGVCIESRATNSRFCRAHTRK